MLRDLPQIRGGTPDGPNPGKVGEGIAQNINGPDPKGAASKVSHTMTPTFCWCISTPGHSLAVHAVTEWLFG